MFDLYYLPYKISDIKNNSFDLNKLKSEMKILVIDDDEFPFINDLKRLDYNISYKEDIDNLNDAEAYDIIMCDIHGVGKCLSSRHEGAYLAQQIKNKYPAKFVIAYTAENTSTDSQSCLSSLDLCIPKGTSLEDWAIRLEDAIRKLADPKEVWKRLAIQLIKDDHDIRSIAQKESDFVKSINNNQYKKLKSLASWIANEIGYFLLNKLIVGSGEIWSNSKQNG